MSGFINSGWWAGRGFTSAPGESLRLHRSLSAWTFSSFNFTYGYLFIYFHLRVIGGSYVLASPGPSLPPICRWDGCLFLPASKSQTQKASSQPERQRTGETSAVSSSLFLFLPSTVSSVATSASSAALSHRAVGVSFVLPPIFFVLANHCPRRAVPTMHQ